MADAAETAAPPLAIGPFDGEPAEWDHFVRHAHGATFCHLAGWREILAGVMGYRPRYRVARDGGGAIRGVLPLVRLDSPLFGRTLVSMPLLNYGGPLGEDAVARALVRDAVEVARTEGARLELRTREPLDPGPEARVHERKVTVLLSLPESPDELWSSFKSKVRSQIRRPLKEEMETRFGPEQGDAFYAVYAHNMRDLGTPVLPRRLFEEIARVFADEVTFAAVYAGDRPVAAGAGFTYGQEFEMTWASSLREFSRSAPNMLLYWSFMESMIRHDVRTFNFGRCTPGEGTHRFKLQWGGHDHPLPWIRWPAGPAGQRDPESGDDGPGRLTRLASAAWQRLPLGVANRLGPVVARQLPWW